MNYVLAFIECGCAISMFHAFERSRKQLNIMKLVAFLLVYAVYFYLLNTGVIGLQFTFVGYIMMFMYAKWAYQETFLHTLMVVVTSSVIISLAEFVLIMIASNLFPSESTGDLYKLIVTSLTFALTILASRMRMDRFVDMIEKWDFSYAIVCILSLMIFTPIAALKVLNTIDIMDYVYIVICIVVMWLLIYRIQKYKVEDRIRKEYLEGYGNVISQIRKRQHKIKNQINAAYGMFQVYDTYDELVDNQKAYLADVLKYELPNDAIVLEEPSIIALIYEKINEAIDAGIEVESSFECSMAHSRVSDLVWVDIIGTLFDNAIEALGNYEGVKKIWISFSINENKKFVVHIENTFKELTVSQLNQFFEMGFSTKGEDRGVGLSGVKQQVNKYRGDIFVRDSHDREENTIVFEIVI